VRDVLGDCERCGRCKTRNRILFGTGAPAANLVFVLDPPNADENEQGRILVEAAGDLFDSMLQKGMGLSREQVYVTSVLKCFSGTDKLPAREELAACTPFLHDQLRVVAPSAIITMGAAAASGVLAPRFDLQAAHGQWTQWKGVPVMPTFSVAAMIAEPRLKRDVWVALKQVMARLDMQRPDETPS
jgi:DNA polymerase